jgi:ParB family chromosome partitioning protein
MAVKKPVLRTIPVARIERDPAQPREEFDELKLAELAVSMRKNGQLQPIAVRKTDRSGHYMVVVGERRWRASQMPDADITRLTKIPSEDLAPALAELHAMVWDLDADAAFVAQVAENVNRVDMNHMEEAKAYARLKEKGWEIGDIAELYGKSAPYVGWRIDLLGLVPELQELVAKGQLGVNAAWYVHRLSPDQQRVFLKKFARGDFSSPSDAEAYAKACKEVEAQDSFFDLDESAHSEEEQEKIRTERKKVVGKIDQLAKAGEILQELGAMEVEDLARVLAGAEGGISAYEQRVAHLTGAARKLSNNLRKAKALAAAVTVDLNPEVIVVEVPTELVDVAPVPETV